MKCSLPTALRIAIQISWNIWFMLEDRVISDVRPYNDAGRIGACAVKKAEIRTGDKED